jgi:hypothetical protein
VVAGAALAERRTLVQAEQRFVLIQPQRRELLDSGPIRDDDRHVIEVAGEGRRQIGEGIVDEPGESAGG